MSEIVALDKVDISLLESIKYHPKYLHMGKSPVEAIRRAFGYIDDGLARLDEGNIVSITQKGILALENYYDEPDGVELADHVGDHPYKRDYNPWRANRND